MHGTKEKAERFGQTAADQVGKAANSAKDTATGVIGTVKDAVQEVTGGAADMIGKAVSQVRDTANEWVESAEGVATNAAQSVKHAAGSAVETVGGMGDEFAGLIRRNPIASVCIALGIGYLAAVACHRRSS